MDLYEELTPYVNEYESFKAKRIAELGQMNQHGIYTNDYINKKADEFNQELMAKRRDCAARLGEKAQRLKASFLNSVTKKPENYDIKLNTTVTLITATQETATETDLRKWTEPFKNDYESMLTFSKVIKDEKRFFLKAYETVPRIMEKFDDITAKPDIFFTSPVISLRVTATKPGTAIDGTETTAYTSLTLYGYCDGLQKKMDAVTEFIDNFR